MNVTTQELLEVLEGILYAGVMVMAYCRTMVSPAIMKGINSVMR